MGLRMDMSASRQDSMNTAAPDAAVDVAAVMRQWSTGLLPLP